jgi:hypothetical protein
MELSPVARLAVPTGTAAATVVRLEPSGDEHTDARRFVAIEQLDEADFRGAFEELVVEGVFVVLSAKVVVLRVSSGGTRSFAAVLSVTDGETKSAPRGGLVTDLSILGSRSADADATALRGLLEAESRQRPIFHGTTDQGVTYSGFEAQNAAAILERVRSIVPEGAEYSPVALVFAGDPVEVPRGLFIGVLGATA